MLRPTGAGQQGPAWRWCHASRHCAAETGSLQCSAQLCLQPRPTLDSSSVLLQAHSYNSLYKCCLVLWSLDAHLWLRHVSDLASLNSALELTSICRQLCLHWWFAPAIWWC